MRGATPRRETQSLGEPLRPVAPDGLGVQRLVAGVGREPLRRWRSQVKLDEIFARGEAVLFAVLEEEGGLRPADGVDGVERREPLAEPFQLPQAADDIPLRDGGARLCVRVVLGERKQVTDAERWAESGQASMLRD